MNDINNEQPFDENSEVTWDIIKWDKIDTIYTQSQVEYMLYNIYVTCADKKLSKLRPDRDPIKVVEIDKNDRMYDIENALGFNLYDYDAFLLKIDIGEL